MLDRLPAMGRTLTLVAVSLILAGCGAVRMDLPLAEFVPMGDPMAIDGLWRLDTNGKIYRIEAGRIWITEALVVGPVRNDPGQVVVENLIQRGPLAYEGRDLALSGAWQAVVTETGLDVHVSSLVPTDFAMIPIELDHPEWYASQRSADVILPIPGSIASTHARAGGNSDPAAGIETTPTLARSAADPTAPIWNRAAFGRYHALVIGNDGYESLPRLETAINDARAVSLLLRDRYGFEVTTLEDATRAEILVALRGLRERLTAEDNLLIYYAGHGWLDRDADEGYWLPVNAERDSDVEWISNATITGYLRSIQAKHVLIVADSCYSGTLTRGIKLDVRPPDYLERMARLRARIVLSSGGLEPVADGGGEGHSAFARSFLDELRENPDVIDSTTLYSRIRRPIMLRADQSPELADIRKAGHEGGDFLFIRVDDGR